MHVYACICEILKECSHSRTSNAVALIATAHLEQDLDYIQLQGNTDTDWCKVILLSTGARLYSRCHTNYNYS